MNITKMKSFIVFLHPRITNNSTFLVNYRYSSWALPLIMSKAFHDDEERMQGVVSFGVSYTAMNMHNMYKHSIIRTLVQQNVHVHVIVHAMLCSLSIPFLWFSHKLWRFDNTPWSSLMYKFIISNESSVTTTVYSALICRGLEFRVHSSIQNTVSLLGENLWSRWDLDDVVFLLTSRYITVEESGAELSCFLIGVDSCLRGRGGPG